MGTPSNDRIRRGGKGRGYHKRTGPGGGEVGGVSDGRKSGEENGDVTEGLRGGEGGVGSRGDD